MSSTEAGGLMRDMLVEFGMTQDAASAIACQTSGQRQRQPRFCVVGCLCLSAVVRFTPASIVLRSEPNCQLSTVNL